MQEVHVPRMVYGGEEPEQAIRVPVGARNEVSEGGRGRHGASGQDRSGDVGSRRREEKRRRRGAGVGEQRRGGRWEREGEDEQDGDDGRDEQAAEAAGLFGGAGERRRHLFFLSSFPPFPSSSLLRPPT